MKADAAGHARFEGENGANALLAAYKPDKPNPRVIPLNFELKPGTIRQGELGKLRGFVTPTPQGMIHTHLAGKTIFQVMPVGLIATAENLPGFWFVPREELDQHISRRAQQGAASQPSP